ncbi:MAG: endonuclease/exonuclease/phosphatase family protein [Planctomycetaceae bacterium]|nr:endonuclease/exonuclease/phosphatase family protein [Planctomycetaceae bacterium]
MTRLSSKVVTFLTRRIRWLFRMGLLVTTGASLLTLLAQEFWLADLVANLRIQLLIGLASTAALGAISRKWKLLALPVVLAIWQGTWIIPAFQYGETADSEPLIRVCSMNVLTSNRNHDAILAQMRELDADVVAVLELSSSLSSRIVRDLDDLYPHRYLIPDDGGNFGIGLLSKVPFQSVGQVNFSRFQLPSIDATVVSEGNSIRILATHTIPPMGRDRFQDRNQHLQNIATWLNDSATNNSRVIVTGDLNLTPWSPVFRSWCRDAELDNATDGCGLGPTWYRFPGFPFGLILDHGLCSWTLAGTRTCVADAMGSDHRAVVFEFRDR